ncbi:MAG: S8 family serine peptidase [Polyangiaceae bacterium]|nr:S8 family serine peptidase [Polyangiaceae bacterium]
MRLSSFVSGALFCAAALVITTKAAAEQTYRDGDRAVSAKRLGPANLDARGRRLVPVELAYDNGRRVRAKVDDTVIVRIDPGAEHDVEGRGASLLRPLMPSIGLWLVRDTTGGDAIDLASRLSDHSARAAGVRYAAPNLYVEVRSLAEPYTPTDPEYGGQWYFHNLNMPEAWGLSRGDAGTSIVVVDTGCDLAHPDLVDKLDPGLDVVDGDDDPSYDLSNGGAAHGTACAGLVAASTDNDEGIAGGCPECRLRCVRMLSDDPLPVSANIEAFDFALDVDASVVSNSWGFVDPIPVPQGLADAITNVATNGRGGKGALVLFAAGNDDREINEDELQNVEGVVCVGAINNFDESTPFTNSGSPVDVVAPTGTLTTDISGPAGDDETDYTSLFGGTSSACPVAAGVAALLASAAPEKTGAELSSILIETTRSAPFATPDESGHDPIYGYGIIDPPKALAVALGLEPVGGGGGAGEGGSGTGGSDGGSGGVDSDGADADDGCSCRAAGSSTDSSAAAALLVAGLLWTRRRRAR